MSNRATYLCALLLGLAGLWACWCDVAMLWDGAYQLCCTLVSGRAFLYLSRFHSWVVWQPVTWLAHGTDNIRLLKLTYAAPFCFAPMAGALLSWWIVRRSAPHLMLWALFGTAIAPLPGQIFMINDSIFQLHLFWPVFFATFLPLSPVQRGTMLLLSLFQLSHPIGIGLCLLCAAAAMGWTRGAAPENKRALLGWASWHAMLCVAGIGKLLVWPDAYAAQEATWKQAWTAFRWGVLGWPAVGLVAAWSAAALLVWSRSASRGRRWNQLAVGCLVLAGTAWLFWATQPALWQTAANYRRYVVPMSLPFFLAAGWELWSYGREPIPSEQAFSSARDVAGFAISAIFLLVLGTQSFLWARLFHHLERQLAAWPSPWLEERDLGWTRETPLAHWGLASQVIILQGREPRTILLTERSVPEAGKLALSPFNTIDLQADPRCWFDWQTLLQSPPPPSLAANRSRLSPQ